MVSANKNRLKGEIFIIGIGYQQLHFYLANNFNSFFTNRLMRSSHALSQLFSNRLSEQIQYLQGIAYQ